MDKILLSHGGGGEEMNALINGLIFKIFDNKILREANDSAILNKINNKIAFSTDSFVVTPIFFNGGDIGKIAACGSINDLAMVGASAKYLSCALIIEEGLGVSELEKILHSIAKIAQENDIKVVCGDTKVVPRGKCDKIFINTSAIGEIICDNVCVSSLRAGAKLILSGDIGRHGALILSSREGLDIGTNLKSDCKSLKNVVSALINAGVKPLAMRDATRGGLSAVLNEWAQASALNMLIFEEKIAVSDEVRGVCEIFGFEPYELANEGTFILAISPNEADLALKILREFDKNANEIGEILEANSSDFKDKSANSVSAKKARVIIQNAYGSKRFLEAPKGELLPRIC